MRIGELAKRSGVTVRTIRYYIEQGLLPPPPRRGKYGDFDESYLQRLQLILRLKTERLSISAIRTRLREMKLITGPPGEAAGREAGIFRSRFADEAGLTSEKVAQLENMGLFQSSEGLLPADALPLARAVAYLLSQGATIQDIATIAESVHQEVSLYRRLLGRGGTAGSLAQAVQWQEQVGAVNAIRQILLRRGSQFHREQM